MKKIIVKKVGKYVPVRMPTDVYNEACKVQEKLSESATKLLGRKVRIPLTRVFRIKMKTPTTIPNDLIKKIAKGKNET